MNPNNFSPLQDQIQLVPVDYTTALVGKVVTFYHIPTRTQVYGLLERVYYDPYQREYFIYVRSLTYPYTSIPYALREVSVLTEHFGPVPTPVPVPIPGPVPSPIPVPPPIPAPSPIPPRPPRPWWWPIGLPWPY